MELRKANESDRAAVRGLYRSAIGTEGCVWDEGYPSEDEISGDLSAGTLYVYADGEEVIGAVSVLPENELDGLPEWEIKTGHCELARVVITRERRGGGLAAAMLTELTELLRGQGVRAIHLLAAKNNPPALALYRRLGFTFYGEVFMFGHDYLMAELIL